MNQIIEKIESVIQCENYSRLGRCFKTKKINIFMT